MVTPWYLIVSAINLLTLFYASMLMLIEIKGHRMLRTKNDKLDLSEKGGEEK